MAGEKKHGNQHKGESCHSFAVDSAFCSHGKRLSQGTPKKTMPPESCAVTILGETSISISLAFSRSSMLKRIDAALTIPPSPCGITSGLPSPKTKTISAVHSPTPFIDTKLSSNSLSSIPSQLFAVSLCLSICFEQRKILSALVLESPALRNSPFCTLASALGLNGDPATCARRFSTAAAAILDICWLMIATTRAWNGSFFL